MANVKSFACPSCNAPLTVTGNEVEIRCQFCGNMVIIPPELRTGASSPSSQVPPTINVVMGSTSNVQPTSSSGCGLLVPLIIIGVIVVVIAGVVLFAVIPTGSEMSSAVSPAVLESTATPWPVSVAFTFGGEGTGVGLFSDPNHFAVDGKGYVYVSDRTTGLIQRFAPDGQYLSQWKADPNAEYGPTCLTADHAGNVFACGDSALLKFDGATGKLLAKFTGDKAQRNFFRSGAAALVDGSVLAYESNSDQIIKLDTNGHVLNRTDKISSHLSNKATTFNVEIAVDGLGNSFVLETATKYILEYKPDGTFVSRIGSDNKNKTADEIFSSLTIAVDNQSRIFAIDSDVIKVFNQDGHPLTSYKLPPDANHVSAFGMGFDDVGNLYVLGSDKKIYKLKFLNNR